MSKKIHVLLILLFIAANTIFAQEKISIWENLAPGTEGRENQEEWGENNKSVTKVYQPDLTVFLPEKSDKPTSAILVCPGGGYNQVVMRKEGYALAQWLNENNIAAFVLKYRLDPAEALQDANRAMSLIRSRADEFNIDGNKLGVMGFSAGAHLSFNLCVNNSEKQYFETVDSISSRPDFFTGIYGGYPGLIDLSPAAIEKATDTDNPDLPPSFLVHAGDDSKAPVYISALLYLKLKKMGVPAELHIYEFGEHGFGIETNRGEKVTSTVESWKARFLDWLRIKELR